MEALASFGGGDLGSVLKKAESFGDKLERQKKELKLASDNPTEPRVKRSRYVVNLISVSVTW